MASSVQVENNLY